MMSPRTLIVYSSCGANHVDYAASSFALVDPICDGVGHKCNFVGTSHGFPQSLRHIVRLLLDLWTL